MEEKKAKDEESIRAMNNHISNIESIKEQNQKLLENKLGKLKTLKDMELN